MAECGFEANLVDDLLDCNIRIAAIFVVIASG
jgi:hypothetical protein